MALDLETLNQQLDALRKSRSVGLSRVVVEGIETSFKSDAEMAAAEAALVARINALTGASVTTILVTASKGLGS